jgi:hypothetical protein
VLTGIATDAEKCLVEANHLVANRTFFQWAWCIMGHDSTI